MPILVERGTDVPASWIDPIAHHGRLEVLVVDDLTPAWQRHTRRAAQAVVVVTTRNPFAAMSRVRTGELSGHLALGITSCYAWHVEPLIACGATAVLLLPTNDRYIDRMVGLISAQPPASNRRASRILLDPIGLRAWYDGNSVRLTQREFAILRCLDAHSGQPVSAAEVLNCVWADESAERGRKLLDVHVCHVREKLATINLNNALSTVRRYGYVLHAQSS